LARKRFITSEISVDERLAEIAVENPTVALMWPWIILHLDDWGRGPTSPVKIKLSVFPAFPFTTEEIQRAVERLGRAGLVYLYEVDGEGYMAVRPKTWIKYQTYLKGTKRGSNASRIPGPVDAPWADEEEGGLRQEMSRMSANVSGCQLTNGNVSRQTVMSVPSPSPSPSPSLKDKYIDLTPREEKILEIVAPYTMTPKEIRSLCSTFTFTDEEVVAAMSHPNTRNLKSPYLYLRNWFKRSAGKTQPSEFKRAVSGMFDQFAAEWPNRDCLGEARAVFLDLFPEEEDRQAGRDRVRAINAHAKTYLDRTEKRYVMRLSKWLRTTDFSLAPEARQGPEYEVGGDG